MVGKVEDPTTRSPRETTNGNTLSIKTHEDDTTHVPRDTNFAVFAYPSAAFKVYTDNANVAIVENSKHAVCTPEKTFETVKNEGTELHRATSNRGEDVG